MSRAELSGVAQSTKLAVLQGIASNFCEIPCKNNCLVLDGTPNNLARDTAGKNREKVRKSEKKQGICHKSEKNRGKMGPDADIPEGPTAP